MVLKFFFCLSCYFYLDETTSAVIPTTTPIEIGLFTYEYLLFKRDLNI
jgi:hypothetical protein